MRIDVVRGVGGSGRSRQLVPLVSDSEKNTSVHQVIGRIQRKLSGIKWDEQGVVKILLLKVMDIEGAGYGA